MNIIDMRMRIYRSYLTSTSTVQNGYGVATKLTPELDTGLNPKGKTRQDDKSAYILHL
jgi:hypothetical protein